MNAEQEKPVTRNPRKGTRPNEYTGKERLWKCHTNRSIDALLKVAEVEWKGGWNWEIWNSLTDAQFDEMIKILESAINTVKREKVRKRLGKDLGTYFLVTKSFFAGRG